MKLLSEQRFNIFLIVMICTISVQVYSAGLLRPIRASGDNATTTPLTQGQPGSDPGGQPGLSPELASSGGSGGGKGETKGPNGTKAENTIRFPVAAWDFHYVNPFILVALLIIFILCFKLIVKSQEHFTKYFPESCMLIVTGAILGIIMYFAGAPNYQLNPHTFFLVLLPPIIFDAGYYMPVRPFFDNLGSILSYAIMGTLLNALWLGFSLYGVSEAGGFGETPPMPMLHLLSLAAVLAAVDPVAVLAVFDAVKVNEVLYIVVFGEALLNDGIAVVLYRIFDNFSKIGKENIIGQDIGFGVLSFFVVVICSPSLGYCLAVLAGFISRFTHMKRMFEPMFVFSIGYISFICAELLDLSGILSAVFCGIAMRKYVEHNYSNRSIATVKYTLRTAAVVAEGIIFLYIGVTAVNADCYWNTGFILLAMAFCLVYRFLATFILTWIGNMFRHRKLNAEDKFIMGYGGLRGAIAFALALQLDPEVFPASKLYVSTTVFVVYFTNIVLGTTVEPIVAMLRIPRNINQKHTMNTKIAERVFDNTMGAMETIAGHIPIIQSYFNFKLKFSDWHNNYIKPLVVGTKDLRGTHRGFEVLNVYVKLSEKDAKQLVKTPSYAADITRLGSYIRRQTSAVDLSRVGTETNFFNPAQWSLPSFSIEDRQRAGVDNQTSIEGQLRQGSAANMDPAKYSKFYRRKNITSSSSSQNLGDTYINDLDSNLEPSVKYRKNISDSDNVNVGKESTSSNSEDADWHNQSSAIEFVIKANKQNSSGSHTSGQASKEGIAKSSFIMDHATAAQLEARRAKSSFIMDHATAAQLEARRAKSSFIMDHATAAQLEARRAAAARASSVDESSKNNTDIPQRKKSGSRDASAVLKSKSEKNHRH